MAWDVPACEQIARSECGLVRWSPAEGLHARLMDTNSIDRDRLMWGVVLGVGGAFAITAWYADNPVLAAVIAVITIVSTLVVYARSR